MLVVGRYSKCNLMVAVLAAVCFALTPAFVVGQSSTNKPGLGLGEYEPNLPIILLEAEGPLAPEPRTPCVVRVLCPAKQTCGNTNLLKGGIRLHGAMSLSLAKKSFGIALEVPAQLLDLRTHD